MRTGGDDTVPPALVAKLFDAKPGGAVTEASPNGIVVAQLQQIEPADPAKDATAVKQLAEQLGASLQGDTVAEYDQALRQTFPVKIDQDRIDQFDAINAMCVVRAAHLALSARSGDRGGTHRRAMGGEVRRRDPPHPLADARHPLPPHAGGEG